MKKLLSIVLLSSSLVNAVDWKPVVDWTVCAAVPAVCAVVSSCSGDCPADKRSPADKTTLQIACDKLGQGSRCAFVQRGVCHMATGKACLDPKEMLVDSMVNTGVICCADAVTERVPKEVKAAFDSVTKSEMGRMVFVNVCNTICRSALASWMPAPVKK